MKVSGAGTENALYATFFQSRRSSSASRFQGITLSAFAADDAGPADACETPAGARARLCFRVMSGKYSNAVKGPHKSKNTQSPIEDCLPVRDSVVCHAPGGWIDHVQLKNRVTVTTQVITVAVEDPALVLFREDSTEMGWALVTALRIGKDASPRKADVVTLPRRKSDPGRLRGRTHESLRMIETIDIPATMA
jgi:hypothetical protein